MTDMKDEGNNGKKSKVKTIVRNSLIGIGIIFAALFAAGYVINHSGEWQQTSNAIIPSGGLHDTIDIDGWVNIYHCGPSGTIESEHCPDGQKLITELHDHNLIVERGHTCMADRIAGHSAIACNAFNYVALGTSTTDPADGDTALGAENCGGSYARVQDTDATYANGSPDKYTVSVTFTGFSCAITEYGLFDASSSGNIMSHIEQNLINLGTTDSLTVNWDENIA